MKRSPIGTMILFMIFIPFLFSGCTQDRSDSVSPKSNVSYEDIVHSLLNMDLKPTKVPTESNFLLQGVKAQTLELNNGNVIEVYIYANSADAEIAHDEYFEKTALVDFKVVPQVNQVKNCLFLYYDNQYAAFLQSLEQRP